MFCKFLLAHDFKIFCYVPAWIPSKEQNGMFEYAVVLACITGDLKIENIKLLPEGQALLDLIILNEQIPQEPLVLPEIEKIINPAQIEII